MGPKLAPLGRPWAPWHLVLRLRGAARAAAAPLMAPGGAGPARGSMRSEHHGSAALSAAFGSRPSGGPPFSDDEKTTPGHIFFVRNRAPAPFFSRGARDRRQRGTARAHGPPVGQLKQTPRPVRYGNNTKTRRLEQRTQNTSIPGELQLAVDLASAVLAEQ